MKKLLLGLSAAALITVLFCPVPASAQNDSSTPVASGTGITTNSDNQQVDRNGSPLYFGGPSNSNAVFVGGTPILRVRFAAGGYTAEQRAAEIQERVNLLLGQGPILPSDITAAAVGYDAEVLVKGKLFVTVDNQTATYNGENPLALANDWAQNIRAVLPSLTEAK